ncbi:MAG: hypothetical protein J6S81_02050, partial [Treponema sp.]|nr:hypothetical protein [Treponema sp.]
CAKPPSVACYFLARKKRQRSLSLPGKKSIRGFFPGLQNRFAILHAAKPPIHGLFIDGQGSGEKLRASDSERFPPLQVKGFKGHPLKKLIFL